ncbi:DUF2793 domain-containing protein [Parasphingorhabdus sp. DH2-15]|uniref:DUF2793 domain-containing protein n=1 Tax=Parasphingorhabdus sp. DH2-15 TaxID=3444112 RepID=UPI003F68390D
MSQSPVFNAADRSARLGLPFLFPSQAHKEVTVNEALEKIDAVMTPAIVGLADNPDTLQPVRGESWLISGNSSGEWEGCENHIAYWSSTGWRLCAPIEGQHIYDRSNGGMLFFREGAWKSYIAPELASGGDVVDEQARVAISAVIDRLVEIGVLYPQL